MTVKDYRAAVMEYSTELRELFAPDTTRGRGLAPDTLADRADRLAALSAGLIQTTAGYLDDENPAVRLGAEQHLLAQAAASLRVADGLLAAAAAAGEIEAVPATRSVARSAQMADFDQLMSILETPLAEAGSSALQVVAATRSAGSATADELVAAANDTLDQILGGVAGFGQDTLAGLLGMDIALLRQAAGMISEQLGQAVEGLGEKASRLVARAVAFLIQTYDSLLAALGEEAASELRQKASEWIERLQQGEAMTALLDSVLKVTFTRDRVRGLVEASRAPAPILAQTREAVANLPAGFEERTKLAHQVLAGLGVIKRFPIARTPMVELATAVTYITLFGYTVYIGADYVDSALLERLGRIPGVLHVVETGLAVS